MTIFSMMFTLLKARTSETRPPTSPVNIESPTLNIPGMMSVPSAASGMLERNLDMYLLLIFFVPVKAGISLGSCVANAIPIMAGKYSFMIHHLQKSSRPMPLRGLIEGYLNRLKEFVK